MKQKTLTIIAGVMAVILVALLVIVANMHPPANPQPSEQMQVTDPSKVTEPSTQPTENTQATTSTEPAPSTEPTQPPETSEPTEVTQPATKPTNPGDAYIGSLYTRAELEAMENVGKGYGPGTTSNGKRPSYAVSVQNNYGQYGSNFVAPDNGCIYLTFDCGYEYNNLTADILDTLKEKNVKAVFFITLRYAMKNPELVWRMINEGHTVGNHSANHPVMPDCSIDTMVSEVMELHNYVLEHFGYEMTLFRPPTGEFSTRSLAVVQSLGYKNVFWSFAYQDWETDAQPDPEQAFKTITGRHHSGAIYLLHAISQTNATILADVIDSLRDMGYTLELFR